MSDVYPSCPPCPYTPLFRSSAGDAYEWFMGRWSRKLALSFVEFAGVQSGESVLDVGSGTGAITAAVATASPSSRIVGVRSEEHTSELQSPGNLLCRLLLPDK